MRGVMATGWLKGTVKAVPSGDSLLIMGSVKGGPPPEKTITLAGLIAPKLVSVSASVIDFYRSVLVGPCRFLMIDDDLACDVFWF